jgi:hypothetical protein
MPRMASVPTDGGNTGHGGDGVEMIPDSSFETGKRRVPGRAESVWSGEMD